jgi:radical SAM-linked protein
VTDGLRPCARIVFAKCGLARYVGHLDMARAFDRAIRRAGLPVSYSEGFNPRAKISFSPPLSLGVESLADFCIMDLSEEMAPEELRARLAAQLPPGLTLVNVSLARRGRRSPLADLSEAEYQVWLAGAAPDAERVQAAIEDVLAASELPVDRITGEGAKRVDLRPGIAGISIEGDGTLLRMALQTGASGNVRPEEVLAVLSARLGAPLEAARTVRTALR